MEDSSGQVMMLLEVVEEQEVLVEMLLDPMGVVEMVDMADVERSGRLMAEFIARLDDQFLENLRQEMMAQ